MISAEQHTNHQINFSMTVMLEEKSIMNICMLLVVCRAIGAKRYMKRLKHVTLGDETIEYGKPFQIAKACKKKNRKSESVEG